MENKLLAGILSKLEELAPDKLYGGSLLEDVAELQIVDVTKPGVELATSSFGRKQVIISEGGKTAYFTVKSEKDGDEYVQPDSKKYMLMLRRVRDYGESTKQWLEANGINPGNFAPGSNVLHAVAL